MFVLFRYQPHGDVDLQYGNYERRYQHVPNRRHIRSKYDRYTNGDDVMRQAYSLNDLEDDKHYEYRNTDRDEEKQM